MDFVKILVTIIMIALISIALMKKYYAATTMLLISLIVLIGYTYSADVSVMGNTTSGSKLIDVFEYVQTKFVSTFTSNGVIMMPVYGYAIYMNHIGASKLLAVLGSGPIKKLKSPYFFGIIIAMIIGTIIRLAIPSQTAVGALLVATLFPVLVAAGMSKTAAAAVVVMSACFDWGPADGQTAILLTNSMKNINLSQYFLTYQIYVFPIAILATTITACFVNKYFDKKEGFVPEISTTELITAKDIGLPLYYAVLPLLPLILLLIFSKLFNSSISISAFAATFVSFIVTLLIEFINKKDLKEPLTSSKKQFEGMAQCYIELIAVISCASVFAGAITFVGGFNVIALWLQKANINALLILVVVLILFVLMIVVTTSSTGALLAFTPFMYTIAQSTNQVAPFYLMPLVWASGMGRTLSPIAAANLAVAGGAQVDVLQMIKRNIIPLTVGGIVLIVTTQIMM